MRQECVALLSHGRVPGVPADSSVSARYSLVRREWGLNGLYMKASPGGLPSPAPKGVQKQCLQVTAAAKEVFADYHGIPSVQDTAHPHFKSGRGGRTEVAIRKRINLES